VFPPPIPSLSEGDFPAAKLNWGVVLSTAMRLFAGIVLASILLGIFASAHLGFLTGKERVEFKRDAELLASTIQFLAVQGAGAQEPFDIDVPRGCELRFENQSVVVVVDGSHRYEVGINVTGCELDAGSYHLVLIRTETGVEAHVG